MKNGVLKILLVAVLSVLATSHAFCQQNQEVEKTEKAKSSQVVEEMPVFPGGEKALVAYLKENLKYPSVPAENGIQGRVTIEFTIDKKGDVKDVRVARSADPLLDEEAVRVVSASPRWKPGMLKGAAVNTVMSVAVDFKLSKKSKFGIKK